MATKVSTNITLDPELKKQAVELFSSLGLDLSTAVSLFLKQAVLVQGIPFVISSNPSMNDICIRMQAYNDLLSRKENK